METLATIESKTLAALYPFCAHKYVRYYLQGVLIESADKGVIAVATDGHKMLVINDFDGHCEKSIIVQYSSTMATQMKKKDAGIATILRLSPDSDQLQIMLSNGFAGPGQLIDGKYPAYNNVMPKELPTDSAARQHYDPALLTAFCTAEKVLRNGSTYHGISIINGNEKACGCILYPHISDNLHARGVLMPLKQDFDYAWNPAA